MLNCASFPEVGPERVTRAFSRSISTPTSSRAGLNNVLTCFDNEEASIYISVSLRRHSFLVTPRDKHSNAQVVRIPLTVLQRRIIIWLEASVPLRLMYSKFWAVPCQFLTWLFHTSFRVGLRGWRCSVS